MNKHDYRIALAQLIDDTHRMAWEANQEAMINDFQKEEFSRLTLFNDDQNVGCYEELIEAAQRYQGAWSYENNRHLTPIF